MVSTALNDVSIVRTPKQLTVMAPGIHYEDAEAQEWIVQKFGAMDVWKTACLQNITSKNPLFESSQQDRLNFVRQIVMSDVNVTEILQSAEAHAKCLAKEREILQAEVSGMNRVRSAEMPPREKAWCQMTLPDLRQEMQNLQLAADDLGLKFANLDKMRETTADLRAQCQVLESEMDGDLETPTQAQIEHFGQRDVAAEWQVLEQNAEVYRRHLLRITGVATKLVQVKTDLEELAVVVDESVDLPSLHENEEKLAAYERQVRDSKLLGCSCPQDLTQYEWDMAMEDLKTWRQKKHALVKYLQDKWQLEEEERRIFQESAKFQPVAGDIPTDSIQADVVKLELLQPHLAELGLEDTDIASPDLSELLTELDRTVLNSEKASVWARAQELYGMITERSDARDRTEDINRTKERLFELGLPKMQCPNCDQTLVISNGNLEPAAANAEDIDRVKDRLEKFSTETKKHDECVRMTKEIRSMVLDKDFQGRKPLSDRELSTIVRKKEVVQMAANILRQLPKYALDGRSRQWVLKHGVQYADVLSQVKRLNARRRSLEVDSHYFRDMLVGDDQSSLEEVASAWWTRDTIREWRPSMMECLDSMNITFYRDPPEYQMDDLKNQIRARELTKELTHLENSLSLDRNAPEFELPQFPVYEALEKAFFEDITDMKSFNTAMDQIKSIRAHVAKQQKHFDLWKANQDKKSRLDTVRLALHENLPNLEMMEKSRQEHASLVSKIQMLAAYIPWASAEEQIDGLEKSIAENKVEEGQVKQLVQCTRFAENEFLCNDLDVISNRVSAILEDFFDEPISIQIKLDRMLRSKPQTKPCVHVKINFRGQQLENVNSLSDGQRLRIVIAIAVVLAQDNAFPMFFVDESFSTLDPDLRFTALELLKRYFPNKAIVVVIHDDAVAAHNNVVAL